MNKTEIFKSYDDFLARNDWKVNGVSKEFSESKPDWEKDNASNISCWNCWTCSDCRDCNDCSDYRDISALNNGKPMDVPVVYNIHAKVLEAVSKPESLDMRNWHTCETTHCRAGWVVVLAGEKGRALEKQTTTAFAASQIYKASSWIRVYHSRFYETNEKAMTDIKRCAEVEAKPHTN